MDTSVCPDQDGCARLFHGSLVSGLGPGDCCECCGAVVGDTPRVPSRREWLAAAHEIVRAEDAAALYGVNAARPPLTTLELVGWTWEHADGSYGIVRPGESVRHSEQPTCMRAVFARVGEP
jgi:hypothetical protein